MIRGVVVLCLAGCCEAAAAMPAAAAPGYQRFHSRPDLRPPVIRILRPARGTAPGYLFIAPKRHAEQAGPMIFDDRGTLVWFRPLDTRGVTDFRVQRLRGRPVLTWWRARPTGAEHGSASYTLMNASYRTIAVVRPAYGILADPHELLLTPRGTALLTTFRTRRVGGRLISVGGVQELDFRTRRVLLDWNSLDDVALGESYSKLPRKESVSYDYFHVNSIDVDTDGDLLVSARNTHAVYKIGRRTGSVLWRLGGKRSTFALGRGVRFAWQHDARRQPDGSLRVFDNGAAPKVHSESRVIYLRLDRRRRRASLIRSLVHRPPIVAINQANAQSLPGGHLLVGWGHEPQVTEYDARGRIVLDLRFGLGADTYRAYRFPWSGRPRGRPAVALHRGRIYFSWNGATSIADWQILAGERKNQLGRVQTVSKRKFEDSAKLPRQPWVAVRAVDRAGRVLGTSRVLQRS